MTACTRKSPRKIRHCVVVTCMLFISFFSYKTLQQVPLIEDNIAQQLILYTENPTTIEHENDLDDTDLSFWEQETRDVKYGTSASRVEPNGGGHHNKKYKNRDENGKGGREVIGGGADNDDDDNNNNSNDDNELNGGVHDRIKYKLRDENSEERREGIGGEVDDAYGNNKEDSNNDKRNYDIEKNGEAHNSNKYKLRDDNSEELREGIGGDTDDGHGDNNEGDINNESNDDTPVNIDTDEDLNKYHNSWKEKEEERHQKSTNVSKGKKPMNILLLYADDWTSKTLGAAGNTVVKTPVLDQLAKEGIRFAENCVTTSVCWSSRATLYSGLYMARHNTTLPIEFFVKWKDCLYSLLKERGYYVGHVGKLGIWNSSFEGYDFKVMDEGWHYRQIEGREWHITEKNEADSLRFLRTRDKSKPFFLNTAFYATHAKDNDVRQYIPQNTSMNMYQNVTIPTPVTATQEAWDSLPHFFTDNNVGRDRWRRRYDTPDKFQSMMKNYYRMASEVDSTCGVILKEIERQGELDNTLIIFTTDNGNFHAEHGLADKWYPHQESIRVPLIIKDPRMPTNKAGTVNEDFTLNLDLAPTILSAAGIDPPMEMMGRNIADLYLEIDAHWRTEFFYEHPLLRRKRAIPASEALVRKDYKYFYWPDFGVEQLFDIKSDPYEERDIISSELSRHKTVLQDMRKRFHELKDIVHDMSKIVTL